MFWTAAGCIKQLLPSDSSSCCRTWNDGAHPFDEVERCQSSPDIVSAAARIFSGSGLVLEGIQECRLCRVALLAVLGALSLFAFVRMRR